MAETLEFGGFKREILRPLGGLAKGKRYGAILNKKGDFINIS